ncbi:MAG TPA: hypothetical protein VL550_10145 [Rhodocyclaceae bacterium]|jgi:hypothetical protein|nr:hypothetical protein [Rhodocyclaceae bacterium]
MQAITRQAFAIFGAAFSIAAAATVTANTAPRTVSAGIDFYAHQGQECVNHGQIGLNPSDAHANYCINGKWVASAINTAE